jgi:hypothetical protein
MTFLLRIFLALAVLTLCACSSSSSAVTPVAPTPTPDSITVPWSWSFLDPREFSAAAIGHYSDGTTQNLTFVAAWQSSNPGLIAIGPPGSLEIVGNVCVGNGTIVITATYQGIVGSTLFQLPLDINC